MSSENKAGNDLNSESGNQSSDEKEDKNAASSSGMSADSSNSDVGNRVMRSSNVVITKN